MAFEIDIEAMVTGEGVLTDRLEGPVWRIEARDGRRLLYLPLIVQPGDGEAQFTQPPIDVRGGYFIAWHVPRPEPEGDRPRRRDQRRERRGPEHAEMSEAPAAQGEAQRRRGGVTLPWQQDRRQQQTASPADAQARDDAPADGATEVIADAAHAEAVPEGAPEFGRRVTVHPEGRIGWRIERSLPDGEVRAGTDPWLVKVRPNRVREEMMPEPPDDRRDREAMARFRQERREISEFQRALREMPERFETEMPGRIWAVYGVMDARDTIEMRGEAALLPWSIRREDLEMLRGFAGGGGGRSRGAIEGERLMDVRRMREMLADDHPLTFRSVAHAVHAAEATAQMRVGDLVHQLVARVLAGPDDVAAQRVLRDLAMAEPPTDATIELLRGAADRMDGPTRLIALEGMLRGEPTDLQQQRELFRAANALLAHVDPEDPVAPQRVLELMLEHIEPESELLRDATHGVDFAPLPAERRDHAIAFVIRHAGEHPLAESWLDHRLLGASDPDVVRRTLELLNEADTGPTPMRPMVHAVFDFVLDRRAGEALDDARRPLDLHVPAPAPLRSEGHNLFRSLNSGDPAVFELAWGALPLFYVPEDDGEEESVAADRYELIVDSALDRSDVPGEIVTFLERQVDDRLATRALVRVALEASDPVDVDAVRAMYGSQRPIGEAVEALALDDRLAFAEAVYRALAGDVPRVAPLMRDPRDRAAVGQWFGERLGAGHLPAPGDWLEAYGDEEALLELAASDADDELARAAVAALAHAAGAEANMVEELARRITAESERTVDDVRDAWRGGLREIHARRLAESAGDYRLVVQPPGEGDEYGPPAPIVLGVVELVTDHDAAYLGRNQSVTLTIPEERFAIRMEQPHDLKNFPSREIADLPLREIDEPLDLLEQPDGSWRGEAYMGDHGLIEVRLEPAD